MTNLNNFKDFLIRVSMNEIGGYSFINKFGENPELTTSTDPEDVWEDGGIYNFSTTADIVSIASTADDTQDIIIYGLDEDYEEVVQTITLTGTVRKALDTPLMRVNRMINVGTTDITGIVRCYTGTGATVPDAGDSKNRAIISGDNNQTLMSIYTIPKGKVGFVLKAEAGLSFSAGPSATDYAKVQYRARPEGGVFAVKKVVNCVTTGTSLFFDNLAIPDGLPAKTDVLLRVAEVSDTMGVWGAFSMLLVEEEYAEKFLRTLS